MGRALFSQTYSSPAVRTQPEPVVDTLCQKWGVWNKFDPDSDEFFADAEYEAFVDPAQLRHIDAEVVEMVLSSDSSSESTDGGSSDAGSPMATGPDDPAAMIASAYPNLNPGQWVQQARQLSSVASEWLNDFPQPPAQIGPAANAVNVDAVSPRVAREEGDDITSTTRSYRPNRPRSASAAPALVPLSSLLIQTRSTEVQSEQVPATPAPAVASSPSPISVALPSHLPVTPQRRNVRGSTQTMSSPSPPPSVTPRYYSWQSHPIPAIPTSPTAGRGNRDGLLTNPHARRSFARLGGVQAPVLVSNPAN